MDVDDAKNGMQICEVECQEEVTGQILNEPLRLFSEYLGILIAHQIFEGWTRTDHQEFGHSFTILHNPIHPHLVRKLRIRQVQEYHGLNCKICFDLTSAERCHRMTMGVDALWPSR